MQPAIKAPDNHTVLVIAPFLWGKGDTLADAIKAARRYGKVRQGEYEAWFAPPDVALNQMGTFYVHHDCQVCQQIIAPKKK